MQIAILQNTPSTSEDELLQAVQRTGMKPVEILSAEAGALSGYEGYIIRESQHMSVAMLRDLKQAVLAGKPILGLGQGAAFLVQSGLVPGLEDYRVGITLKDEIADPSEEWVHLRLYEDYQFNAFTRRLTLKQILRNRLMSRPVSFVIPPGLLFEMQIQGLTVFQYCQADGKVRLTDNVAAVSNKVGNVMAMLSHPEFGNTGDQIFQSMHDYIVDGNVPNVTPLHYFPRQIKG